MADTTKTDTTGYDAGYSGFPMVPPDGVAADQWVRGYRMGARARRNDALLSAIDLVRETRRCSEITDA